MGAARAAPCRSMFRNMLTSGPTKPVAKAIALFRTIAISSFLAFVVLLSYPLLSSLWSFLWAQKYYLHRPSYLWVYPIAILGSITAVAALVFSRRLLRSLRLGLISFGRTIWVVTGAASLVLLDLHHVYSAIFVVLSAAVLAFGQHLIHHKFSPEEKDASGAFDPDMPVPEGGKDLLNRAETINQLVSLVLRERLPSLPSMANTDLVRLASLI
jgi:hypothetical protein